MFRKIMSRLYNYGTINFGHGTIGTKQNKITGTITILMSNSTTSQMFKTE